MRMRQTVWEGLEDVDRFRNGRVGPRTILLESPSDRQSSCSFSRDNKGAMHDENTDKKQIMMLRRTTRMLKNQRILGR